MLRLTGRVTRTDHRAGGEFTDANTGQIVSYKAATVVSVLVAEQAIVKCTVPLDGPTPVPGVGDEIDWSVIRPQNSGGNLRCNLDKPWSELFPQPAHRKLSATS